MNAYEGIMQGLSEVLKHAEGKRELRKIDPRIEPLHEYSAKEIRKIRIDLGMTQTFFADFLGVSPRTVEAWEAGRNKPEGPVRRILSMLQLDPELPQRYHIINQL